MKKLTVIGLVLASLVGGYGTSRAVCGWCDFTELCRWEPGINFCCFFHMGTCWMYDCPSCNVKEIPDGAAAAEVASANRRAIARWKTHEPRFYTTAASQVIRDWKGRGPVPPTLLERYKVGPDQAKSIVFAEALRQRTHYDALRILARDGVLDDKALVDALLSEPAAR